MPDRLGQQLGNYRIVSSLGGGAFADVYLGEHRYLKSYAALKVLRTSLKEKEVNKFISEAQTLVRLAHPNIVRVLEFAVDRGTPVLMMDYAPGGTLRQLHPRGSRLSLATTVSYVKQIAAALQYAHNRNIVHRDVKPALAKDPRERFVSVQAFAYALERTAQENGFHFSDEITAQLQHKERQRFTPSPEQTVQRIFLSASPADEAFATRLKADLEKRGILVWHSSSASTLHTPNQEDANRQGIRSARIALVVLSPEAPSSRLVKEHLRIASMYERQLVFVWAEGDDIVAVLPEEWGKTAAIDLVDARETRYEQALAKIITVLGEKTAQTAPLISSPSETSDEPRNPYKGLRAFTRDDALDFFGRDALIQELTHTMKGFLASARPRLLALLGPSGSGKSSVVMAGLLPRLQKGDIPGSADWVYLEPMVPGKRPLEALALTLDLTSPIGA